MGAVPTGLVVALGVPADTETAWTDALADGFRDECARVGAGVVGGDITGSDTVVIGVTAFGDLDGRPPVTRSGARPGDIVAITGRLGFAAAGLALLSHGAAADGETAEVVAAHRRPCPPYACGPEAAGLGATAMIDVSDGLVQDLGHIAEASRVAIAIDPAALPVPGSLAEAAAELGADPLEWVLTGGDDHALAATFPREVRLPSGWTIIGEVAEGEGVQVAGRRVSQGGWDHFRL